MPVVQYILAFAVIIVSVAIVVLVAMQESKAQGLSGAIAGGADSFFGKNKGKTIVVLLPDSGERYLTTPMYQG